MSPAHFLAKAQGDGTGDFLAGMQFSLQDKDRNGFVDAGELANPTADLLMDKNGTSSAALILRELVVDAPRRRMLKKKFAQKERRLREKQREGKVRIGDMKL
jgi:hypothetical protein